MSTIRQLKERIRKQVREALTVQAKPNMSADEKKRKLNQLRMTTGDQSVGTERNPVDFVKEDKKIFESRENMLKFLNLRPTLTEQELSTESLKTSIKAYKSFLK
jgi:hypothetical protein